MEQLRPVLAAHLTQRLSANQESALRAFAFVKQYRLTNHVAPAQMLEVLRSWQLLHKSSLGTAPALLEEQVRHHTYEPRAPT